MNHLDAKTYTAALEGNIHNVIIFLARGANIDVLSKENLLSILAERGATQMLEVLLDAGAAPNTAISETGGTPLMLAAREGHLKSAQILINKGAKIDQFSDGVHGGNINALMYASLNGHLQVVNLLLDHGADVNAQFNGGTTALMWAARNGHLSIMERLVEAGAEINTTSKSDVTALRWAKKQRHDSVVQWLLAMGAEDKGLSTQLD